MANFRLSRKICICLVIVLIFSNSVFAVSISSSVNTQASYTRIGQFNQYITNNYGTQNADANTALLIGMYQSLAKLSAPGVAYGIDRTNHSYYLTGTLIYLQEYLMQITENQYDMYKSEDTYLDGLSSVVSDIKTNTTNSAASDLALLQLVGDQVNIDWKNSTAEYVGVYDPNGNLLNNNTTYSFTDYYIAFTGFHNDRDSITKVNIPLSAWSSNPYVKSVSVYSGVGTGKVSELYYFVETSASSGLNVYFTPAMPYSSVYIRVTVNGNFHTITPSFSYIQYIPNTSEDYFKIYDFIIQYNILQKESNINVEINDSVNVTPIALDVQIGIDDFAEVNTISNKLRTWLSTGVGVSALIGALDQLDDSFFTLHNRSVIETINSGYTDFYD